MAEYKQGCLSAREQCIENLPRDVENGFSTRIANIHEVEGEVEPVGARELLEHKVLVRIGTQSERHHVCELFTQNLDAHMSGHWVEGQEWNQIRYFLISDHHHHVF